MALLDPTDHTTHNAGEHRPTTRPRLCLLSGFAFMLAMGLGFHYLFTALL
jgi:hypothetical protein